MAKTETNPLLHCDACGEDYSATYRRCPFCGSKERKAHTPANEEEYVFEGGYIFDEIDQEKTGGPKAKGGEATPASHGGKRLAGSSAAASTPRGNTAVPQGRSATAQRRAPRSKLEIILANLGITELSPLKIAILLISFIVIIAALIIVLKLALPSDDKPDPKPSESSTPSQSDPVETKPTVSPSTSPSPSQSADPQPTESQIPADQTAVNFTIKDRYKEFTISDKYPDPVTIKFDLLPAGSKGTITWTSSDPSICTVDQNGTVTAVSKGVVTITATLPGAEPQTCKVLSAITGAPVPSTSAEPSPSPSASASSGTLRLNLDEFSISAKYPDPITLKVTGATGVVTWTSSNSAVATVDQNGKVSQVGNGKITITATDETGSYDTCVVYCSGK